MNEGAIFSGAVATFPGAAGHTGADYTAAIDWGDGTETTGITSGTNGGTITVSSAVPHTYAEGGHYTVTVTATDTSDLGHPGHGTGTASVVDAPITASAPSALTLAEGGPVGVPLAHVTDADPGAIPLPSAYTATVAWADGTSSPGVVTGFGGATGYDVSVANHEHAEEGHHTIVVAITDAGGSRTSVSIPANVLDAPLSGAPLSAGPVKGRGKSAFGAPIASFSDADPGAAVGDYTAEVTWGDGHASAATIEVAAGSSFIASGRHSFTRSGTFTVTTLVQDAGGQTVKIQTPLKVTVTRRVRCVVPKLDGRLLAAARAALAKAHCALGKIHRHGRHASVVRAQHPAPGSTGRAGTWISITLGPASKR